MPHLPAGRNRTQSCKSMPAWIHHVVSQGMRPTVRARELAGRRLDALPRMPTVCTDRSPDNRVGEWNHEHCGRKNAAYGQQ
eukprot:2269635-Lingulodinium_polyedra.AAC.1